MPGRRPCPNRSRVIEPALGCYSKDRLPNAVSEYSLHSAPPRLGGAPCRITAESRIRGDGRDYKPSSLCQSATLLPSRSHAPKKAVSVQIHTCIYVHYMLVWTPWTTTAACPTGGRCRASRSLLPGCREARQRAFTDRRAADFHGKTRAIWAGGGRCLQQRSLKKSSGCLRDGGCRNGRSRNNWASAVGRSMRCRAGGARAYAGGGNSAMAGSRRRRDVTCGAPDAAAWCRRRVCCVTCADGDCVEGSDGATQCRL